MGSQLRISISSRETRPFFCQSFSISVPAFWSVVNKGIFAWHPRREVIQQMMSLSEGIKTWFKV
jgi:hypothetical protein